jgi:xanthine dehydrogenase small subunit
VFETPPPPLDAAPVVAALHALAAEAPLAYAHAGAHYEAPRTLAAFAAALQARPQARVLAGSTDIGLWVTKQQRALPDLLWVGEVAELRRIETHDDGAGAVLAIGAAVTLEAGWAALAAHWPALTELWRRFAGLPTRMAGTLVGNLANGSPIGDTAPALMALDAALRLRRGEAVRLVPLHAFYLDYMKNALQPGEFVEAVEVPLPVPGAAWALRAYKISKRFDCDISAVCAGLALRLDAQGRVADVRLAFGGLAGTVRRAAQAEAALRGAAWDEAALQAAQAALARDFTPLTDLRGSAAYRRQTAAALLRRFWVETRPVDPLPAAAVSVWASVAET